MTTPLPAGASRITPYLTVRDAAATRTFYEQASGFSETEMVPRKDGSPAHVGMSLGGESVVMFSPEGMCEGMQSPVTSGHAMPVNLYVYCDDVDQFVDHARNAGATVLSEPEDMFWGDRMARLADPDGYLWTFATRVGDFDPSKVPEFD